MFTNCKTFNEDESEIGKAGISLHKFYTKRWKQLRYNFSKRLKRLKNPRLTTPMPGEKKSSNTVAQVHFDTARSVDHFNATSIKLMFVKMMKNIVWLFFRLHIGNIHEYLLSAIC